MIKEILNGAAIGIIFLCVVYIIGRVLMSAWIDGLTKHFRNEIEEKQSDIKKSFKTKLKEKQNDKKEEK